MRYFVYFLRNDRLEYLVKEIVSNNMFFDISLDRFYSSLYTFHHISLSNNC